MTVSIEKQIFWLQIAINDLLLVKIFESQGHFCSVKLRDWVGEALEYGLAESI